MIETNKDKLVKMAVSAAVNHPSARRGYRTDFDGNPRIGLGMSGVKYNVAVGDPTYGMENEEHVEPGLSISNPDKAEGGALSVLACIGNEVKMTNGDAKGSNGRITGKHGSFIVHFNQDDKENIIPGDKVLVKAWGTGLKINGFEETVRVNKIDPELLEKLGIEMKDGKLVVPVTGEYPAYIMGSGYGMWPVTIDYDIQTTCPEVFDELDLKNIRFGDVVCLRDQLNWYGRGYYEGAVTIGIVVHGWSKSAGHGPGITTILSSKDGIIVPKKDSEANIAKYLGV
ncbi:DUF4438 domain-containing protein [Candidatus Bathyarchaeota archaeon]|jgi:hypothetical protein|nr:DUF4438 domain-containing protein [Candidatus Bathyarchaeota archaeon]MBT4320487.1 DUF4438 domain-containing protein [Candidatus Bathyarchaeota archaeon]MBT4424925.1 DUF4438 domain-containing protein [Candidatus Bathyarchaeota archaeon]MBT5642757.1 DUF4438 domain-containing protein [Candidatus Bathyarchaeota archaeon]MBT6604508.1 DUF4438 domain-containing protein [Candidatus Bathyarchaeota archaeon]